MHASAKALVTATLSAASLLAAAAQAQTGAPTAAPPAAAPAPAPAPTTGGPADPAAAAPGVPAPAGAQPSGDASAQAPGYPPPYTPPPGYAPPPGGAPPPGYGPQAPYGQPSYGPQAPYGQPGYYPAYPPQGYYAPMQPAGPPPGYHEHDGFYMRLSMGGGYLTSKMSVGSESQTISGGGVGMNMAFGGSINPNFVIFGELTMQSAINPTVEYGGTSETAEDSTLNLMGIGPGVAYYFMPLNLYLSGALSFSQATANDNSSSSSDDSIELTNMGVGTSITVGKEWWVSDNWGLGVAGMFRYASMKLKDADGRMSASGFTLLFSATYN